MLHPLPSISEVPPYSKWKIADELKEKKFYFLQMVGRPLDTNSEPIEFPDEFKIGPYKLIHDEIIRVLTYASIKHFSNISLPIRDTQIQEPVHEYFLDVRFDAPMTCFGFPFKVEGLDLMIKTQPGYLLVFITFKDLYVDRNNNSIGDVNFSFRAEPGSLFPASFDDFNWEVDSGSSMSKR